MQFLILEKLKDGDKLIDKMKKQMKKNAITKAYLDEMVNNGIPEDIALNIMIAAWIQGVQQR